MDQIRSMDAFSVIERLKYVGNYQLDKTLGEGTFGKVKLGTHLMTGEKVAIKILDKEKLIDLQDRERLNREIRIMKLISHPNIVRLYEVIDTSKHMFLVLEYASGGELFDYIVAHERVKEKDARRFFRQLISGVYYCHQKNIIHRDLKPENLLLDENLNIKIVDFGFSNLMTSGHYLRTFCGSPAYAAPEMVSGRDYNGMEVDLWAMGVILYALVCGYLPFDNGNISKLYQLILKGDYKVPEFVSPECKHLIGRLLTNAPEKRATLEEVRNHPWINAGFVSPPDCISPNEDVVDLSIIKELEGMGFDGEYLLKSLQSGDKNQATASYWLLFDKHRRESLYTSPYGLVGNSSPKKQPFPTPLSPKTPVLVPSSPSNNQMQSPVLSVLSVPSDSDIDVVPTPSERNAERRLPNIKERRTTASKIQQLNVISEDEKSPSGTGLPFHKRVAQNIANVFSPKSPSINKPSSSAPRRRHSSNTSSNRRTSSGYDEPEPDTSQPLTSPRGDTRLFTKAPQSRRMSLETRKVNPTPPKVPAVDKSDLREVRGIFTMSTTSLKNGADVLCEVKRVLEANNIAMRENGYVIDCECRDGVRFEIEICRVQNLTTISGVRMKRVTGDTWAYKKICQKLSSEFQF